jgi:transcriptional regulator with XRE-family HTH domain
LPDLTPQRERFRLAASLRALREETGQSGSRFAERLGWAQSRVSRLETGKIFPTEDDIRAWGTEADASPDVIRDLLAQRERARVEYATWGEIFRRSGGAAGKQDEIGRLEQASTRIAKYQPVMIPSQLQTAEYAAELLRSPSGPGSWGESEARIGKMVAARMERQQILYQPGKQIQLVILEAALRTRLVSVAAQRGQLDRMLALEGLPSLDLGIIPSSEFVPVYPTSGFVLFDDHLVVVETVGGEHGDSDPAIVSRYSGWFDLLHKAAVHSPDTAGLIRQALADLPGG